MMVIDQSILDALGGECELMARRGEKARAKYQHDMAAI